MPPSRFFTAPVRLPNGNVVDIEFNGFLVAAIAPCQDGTSALQYDGGERVRINLDIEALRLLIDDTRVVP